MIERMPYHIRIWSHVNAQGLGIRRLLGPDHENNEYDYAVTFPFLLPTTTEEVFCAEVVVRENDIDDD